MGGAAEGQQEVKLVLWRAGRRGGQERKAAGAGGERMEGRGSGRGMDVLQGGKQGRSGGERASRRQVQWTERVIDERWVGERRSKGRATSERQGQGGGVNNT